MRWPWQKRTPHQFEHHLLAVASAADACADPWSTVRDLRNFRRALYDLDDAVMRGEMPPLGVGFDPLEPENDNRPTQLRRAGA
jgi:hypothetical protein